MIRKYRYHKLQTNLWHVFVLASNKNRFSLDVGHTENLILLYVNNKGADSLGIHPCSLVNALFAYWSVLLNI